MGATERGKWRDRQGGTVRQKRRKTGSGLEGETEVEIDGGTERRGGETEGERDGETGRETKGRGVPFTDGRHGTLLIR